MSTNNVSHGIALIHYGWKEFIPVSNETKTRKTINHGLTYVSFSRTKKIGNILNLTYTGYMPDIYIGDWIVLKTTSKGSFDLSEEGKGSPNHYLKKGIVRFIGQIHSVTSQYNTDADGILKKSYNILIREWSHCLNLPIRYSDEIRILSTSEDTRASAIQEELKRYPENSDYINQVVAADWKELVSSRLPAFKLISNVLRLMGARSALSEAKDENKNVPIYLTTSDLPEIPAQIYYDHIYQKTNEKYEQKFPFNTGFMTELIGPQLWGYRDPILRNNTLDTNVIDNIINTESRRPPAFISPTVYSEGRPFLQIAQTILDSGGEYETFSDFLYFSYDGRIVCRPTLIIRDKPISFRSVASAPGNAEYTDSDKNYGFTYKDDIPRITLPISNIIGITASYTMQDTFNYLQFTAMPKVLNEEPLLLQSLKYGRYKDISSQKRFGGQEYVAQTLEFVSTVDDILSVKENPPKVAAPKDKTASNKKEGTAGAVDPNATPVSFWYYALTQKYRYYLPIRFAMPNCTVQLIDNDFPLAVGMMVRIPLGGDRPTICGEIEEISYTTNITGEGRVANQTYVKLTELLMEDPADPQKLVLLSKEFSRTLFVNTTQENNEHKNFIKTR